MPSQRPCLALRVVADAFYLADLGNLVEILVLMFNNVIANLLIHSAVVCMQNNSGRLSRFVGLSRRIQIIDARFNVLNLVNLVDLPVWLKPPS